METEKKLVEIQERVQYARDILGHKKEPRLEAFAMELEKFVASTPNLDNGGWEVLEYLERKLSTVEEEVDTRLTPMDKVRIVRHPSRICLKDILENVYDNYTEIGGMDEFSIDPGMLIARAYVTRRVGKKLLNQPVMVVGQEKGHGQEFRNGGSIKPWGNAKALRYMKVAERENIPIHTYVSTPGSYPVEDFPGAAQQVAENIYEMGGISVPIVAVFSEGGSGGAEAIGLADKRLMLSHGYYSVISPEGAAAIEGRLRGGQRATPELIEKCAMNLRITAQDNFKAGYIDRVIDEPALGARSEHYDFYKKLRAAIIQATDEVALSVKYMRLVREMAMSRRLTKGTYDPEHIVVRWNINSQARERLVERRYRKYRALAQQAYLEKQGLMYKMRKLGQEVSTGLQSLVRHDLPKFYKEKVLGVFEEVKDEAHVVTGKIGRLALSVKRATGLNELEETAKEKELTTLSNPEMDTSGKDQWIYVSPRAEEDREISCPRTEKDGCLDIWARDLFNEFAGVCPNCGHHFPMEYKWLMSNVFAPDSIRKFNNSIEATNPTNYPGFDEKLAKAKEKLAHKSSCQTFEATILDEHGEAPINLVVAVLMGGFRGGSLGAAEGEKIIRAAERAARKHQPFFVYAHGTAGIRIQEGTNGLIQMPRCALAVREYIESGGLYIVLYDTKCYGGTVASFLGCSPYQFAVRSSRIGFAGPGVITETTGIEFPPDYHSAYNALSRGHIQDIWDRREVRKNLHQALLTMGGRNLYYR